MSETPAPDYQVDGLDLRHVQLALDDWGKLRDLYGLFQQGRVLAQDGVHWYNTQRLLEPIGNVLCLLFIHPLAHGSEVSPAARNTLDSARIPRASMLMICGLFLKGRVLAQDGDGFELGEPYIVFL